MLACWWLTRTSPWLKKSFNSRALKLARMKEFEDTNRYESFFIIKNSYQQNPTFQGFQATEDNFSRFSRLSRSFSRFSRVKIKVFSLTKFTFMLASGGRKIFLNLLIKKQGFSLLKALTSPIYSLLLFKFSEIY